MKTLFDVDEFVRKNSSWSIFSPYPISVYSEECDMDFVFWLGLVMNKSVALMVLCSLVGIPITPKTKKIVFNKYNTVVSSGVFGENSEEWTNILSNRVGSETSYFTNIVKHRLSEKNVDVDSDFFDKSIQNLKLATR